MARKSHLVHRLAEPVVALSFADIPRDVVEKAKLVILHNLAVALGGVGTEQVRIALQSIEPRVAGVTVIGSRIKATAEDAAFVNSILIRALRMEDTIIPSFIHPGASLLPAALAVGESYGASGADLLAALIAGYDVLGRVAGTIWSWEHGHRTAHHVFGAFGVAAVAARLMRLDLDRTAAALAYAADLGAMITYGFEDFQYGVVTRNGLLAARLGAVGAPFPDDALEGPYGFYATQLGGVPLAEHGVPDGLGRRFEIMSAVLKPHPCTALNLVPINMVRSELRRTGRPGSEIKRIWIGRARAAGRVPNIHNYGPFERRAGASSAISSLPCALAVLLTETEITPRAFDQVNDERLAPIMAKIEIELVDGPGLLDHEVRIDLVGGETFRLSGGSEFLPQPDGRRLLEINGAPVIGREAVDRLVTAVATLESAPNLHEITVCLNPI